MTKKRSRSGWGWDCTILLVAAGALAFLSFLLHRKAPAWSWTKPTVTEVAADELKNWTQPPLWIDARSTNSYEKQHIPGAILLNETEWEQLLAGFLAVWQPGTKVVVYCDSQTCDASQAVALRLQRELQITEIYVLKGGWTTWLKNHQ